MRSANDTIASVDDLTLTAVSNSWMCRQRLSRNQAPLLLSCLPNRAGKVNSLLHIFSTLRRPSIAASLHLSAHASPQPRLRRAFTRRGPCVPSRSAPGPSHALHQVRQQGCPSTKALSSPKGGSRQEIADIPRFAAPPGDAHRARGSLVFPSLLSCWGKASAFPCSSSQSTAPASGAAVA
jgi:hypothetical protein